MSKILTSQTGLDPEPIYMIGADVVIAHGTTVPADGTAGYKPGAIFVHTDGSAGGVLYVNDGTASSADFNATGGTGVDLSGLTATAAEINAAADVSGRIVNV